MRRTLSIILLVLAINVVYAKEDPKVTAALREKYPMVQYRSDCDGWYLLRFSESGMTYYAFSDNAGNVIATYATEYELHNGYIRLHIVDLDKKMKHDEWERQKVEYDKDYYKYTQVKEQYEKQLSDHNAKVSNAKSYAEAIWEERRQEACKAAVAEAQRRQQANAGSSTGSQLGNAIGNLILAGAGYYQRICDEAANKVPFDPIFNQVKRDRGLTSAPTAPYNPKPHLPSEPSSGYSWQQHSLMQPCPYSYVDYASVQDRGEYADVKKDGKYGLVDYYFKEVLPCTNDEPIKAGKVFGHQVVKVDGKYGMLDANGKLLLPIQYSELKESGTSVMLARKDGKWQFLKSNGTPVSSYQFEEVSKMGDNLLCKSGDMHCICTKSGDMVLPLQFSRINLKDNVLYARRNDKMGVFDVKGKQILPTAYDSIGVSNRMYICKLNGKYGTCSLEGKEMLPTQFDQIEFKFGYIIGKEKDKAGIYTMEGKELYPAQFQDIKIETVENIKFMHTKIQGRWGVTDFEKGTQILKNAFSKIEIVTIDKKPYFKVYQLNKMGLYGLAGQLLVPCEYERITMTNIYGIGSVFVTVKDGFVSVFNALTGICLLPQSYYTSWKYEEPFFYVISNDKVGVYSTAQGEILSCKYDNVKYLPEHKVFWIKNNEMQGYVTLDGKELFEPVPFDISIKEDYIQLYDKENLKGAACNFAGAPISSFVKKKDRMIKSVESYRKSRKHDLAAENAVPLAAIDSAYNAYYEREKEETEKRSTFDYFARNYVERVINDWQKKGAFEKTESYQQRVNENTRSQKIRELTQEAERLYVNEEKKGVKLNLTLGQYDSDHEVYLVTDARFGRMLVSVPYDNAEAFLNSWNSISYTPEYFIENGMMAISKMTFTMPDGKKFYYSNEQALNYEVADIKYNFDPVDLRFGSSSGYMKSVTVDKAATEVEGSSVLVTYNNDFRELENPDLDDAFPYALFRIKLEGKSDAIRRAKDIVRLNLGQMFTVEKTVTKYSNQLLFLVRKSVKNVYIDCGDGCQEALIWSGHLNANLIYDATITVE